MCMQVKILAFCFVSVILAGVPAVYIKNNEYKGVTIAFSPSIQRNAVDVAKLKNVIEKSSKVLYSATRRRAFFSEVDFLYPSTWPAACEKDTVNAGQHPQGISVYVAGSEENKNDGNLLRAQHNKGCSAIGEVIYMSPHWLGGGEEELSHEFVQQWATYRYGVFEEVAEPVGWSCYTNDGKQWIQNGCYSTNINVSLVLDHNGLPSCQPANMTDYSSLKSSLMSTISSSSITDFCDGSKERPHNPVAPTLHNRICGGKPVWSVIKESEDFMNGRNKPRGEDSIPPVSFRCFQERTNRIIFSMQISSTAKDVENILADVRLSLLRFLLHEVWRETQVSIVPFHKEAELPLHLNLSQPENVAGVVDKQVRAQSIEPNICLSCGLQNAFNLSEVGGSQSTFVVFVAFASAFNALETQGMLKFTDILKSSPSRTYVMIILDKEENFAATNLVTATRKTGGEVYVVPKSSALFTTDLTLYMSSILKNPLSIQDNVVVIHQTPFLNIKGGGFQDTVQADNCLEGEMIYTLTCDSNDRLGANMSTKCSTLPIIDKGSKFICAYTTTLTKENTTREWAFSFYDKGGVFPFTCSSIATVRLKPNSRDLLTVRGWMSTDTVEPNQSGRSVLIVYAEIMHNFIPVTEAEIQAVVQSSTNSTPTVIHLLDTGNGDPDMKKGDGIYSRYLTRIQNKGIHSVVIHARSNLTTYGSAHANQNQMTFSRIVPIGSFVVTEKPQHTDYYPPNRIGDLRVAKINHNSSVVTLQWTAPGDNLDDGTAKRYILKFSQSRNNLEKSTFENGNAESLEGVSQNIPELPSGELQVVNVPLSHLTENGPFYFAVQAINKNDDTSLPSNIVQVFFERDAPVRITTTTTTITKTTVSDTTQSTVAELNSSSSTAEGISEKCENSTLELTNTTAEFVSTIANTTAETSTVTTRDEPLNNRSTDPCDKDFIIIVASSVGGGVLLLLLVINAVVCGICFRKNKPKELSRKTSLRPPHNITVVRRDSTAAKTDYLFSGPNENLNENLQDFDIDPDYTFVPGSQRLRSRNPNYNTRATLQTDNVSYTNGTMTQRYSGPPNSRDSMPRTSPIYRVQYRGNNAEDDTDAPAISLGLV